MDGPSIKESCFDEVFDSQHTFRVLLQSMSRPGTVRLLKTRPYSGTPGGLNPHVLTVLKTLCDNRTSFSIVAVGPEDRVAGPDNPWSRYVQINTGSIAATPQTADYVVFDGELYSEAFGEVKRGSLEFPEEGATCLIAVGRVRSAAEAAAPSTHGSAGDASAEGAAPSPAGSGGEALPAPGGSPVRFALEGPGIRGRTTLEVEGLSPRYLEALREFSGSFPLGADVLLVDGDGKVAGVPRSSRVMIGRPGGEPAAAAAPSE